MAFFIAFAATASYTSKFYPNATMSFVGLFRVKNVNVPQVNSIFDERFEILTVAFLFICDVTPY
jgi:hypothetical protein